MDAKSFCISNLTPLCFDSNAVIALRGSRMKGIYLIESGSVYLTNKAAIRFWRLKAGNYFGDGVFLESKTRYSYRCKFHLAWHERM
jgi:hypothetical protein